MILEKMGWKDDTGKWDIKEIVIDIIGIFAIALIIGFVMVVG